MVTIPIDICDQMGIDEDTELGFDCIDNKIVVSNWIKCLREIFGVF